MTWPVITDAYLRTLKPRIDGQRLEIPDVVVPGLLVRVTNNRTISYSFRRMVRGRRLIMTLGQWPMMGIDEARKCALSALADWRART